MNIKGGERYRKIPMLPLIGSYFTSSGVPSFVIPANAGIQICRGAPVCAYKLGQTRRSAPKVAGRMR